MSSAKIKELAKPGDALTKSYIFSKSTAAVIPAPHFEGAEVGPALLNLLGFSGKFSYGYPDVHIKLRGSKDGLPSLKIVTSRCEFDKETGHIKVVVRKPGGSYYGEENYRTFHFLKDNDQPNSHSDIIESMTLGYPRREITKKTHNTYLGTRTTFSPDGSSTMIDLVPRVLRGRKKTT